VDKQFIPHWPSGRVKKKPWVGLTDEEIYVEAEKEEQAHGFILGAMWAETKLRDKNGG